MKFCSKCGINPQRETGRYCLSCHARYTAEWRKTHPLNEIQRMKDIARSYLGVYLRRGKIKAQPCVSCGAKAQAHHPDYSKPLDVIWLCRKHHLELHKQKQPKCSNGVVSKDTASASLFTSPGTL